MKQTPEGYELEITRVFDAPRELVWQAWTDPSMAMQWMGPRGFRATEFSVRGEPNTPWHLTLQGNVPHTGEPVNLSQGGTTLEVRPPELLRYTFRWMDRSCVGLPASPIPENIVTVRFEEFGARKNKTLIRFTQGPFATEGECQGHTGGWNSALDRFAEFINAQPIERPAPDPSEVPTELHLKRFFAAPRDLVFAAWTKPEMLKEWWGPKVFTNPVCGFEARGGGRIYIEMQSPTGERFPMSGEVIEFYPPYRFHFTANALGEGGKTLFTNWNSVFFEEVEGGTQVTLDVHVMHMNDPMAPQYLKGMSQGWSQSLDKLTDFLTNQAPAV